MILGSEFYMFLAAAVLVVMGLAAIPDLFQTVARYWQQTFFIATSALLLYAVVAWKIDAARMIDDASVSVSRLWESDAQREQRTKMEISDCKAFVQQAYESRTDAARLIPASMTTDSRWEDCAERFGLNYWKHDIFIDGRNGGQMLCEAYRGSGARSSQVEAWCATVFAQRPAGQ